MKILKLFFIPILLFLLYSQNSQAHLKTQGREIVDSNGQKILLRGFRLGGWLAQEGYQLHIPGFGSPSSIRKLIVDLIGQENADQFCQRYISNYMIEEDIQKISAWGVNSIQVSFNYRLLAPEDQPGFILKKDFKSWIGYWSGVRKINRI